MRFSSGWYIFVRGVLASVLIVTLHSLLISTFRIGGFYGIVLPEPEDTFLQTIAFYLPLSVMMGMMGGTMMGIAISMIVSYFTAQYTQKHYASIADEQIYARDLMRYVGGLSSIVTSILGIFLFVTLVELYEIQHGFFMLLSVGLAGIAGAIIGRGYAYHDMKQRREKKKSDAA